MISMDAVSVEFSKSEDLYCPCKNGMGGTVPNRPWTLNPKTRPSGCVATVTGFEACWCLGSGWHGQAVSPRSLHTYQCYGSMYSYGRIPQTDFNIILDNFQDPFSS